MDVIGGKEELKGQRQKRKASFVKAKRRRYEKKGREEAQQEPRW